ncbi:MAG: Do family serine endopeptidase [Pseudomonadota bacterium]
MTVLVTAEAALPLAVDGQPVTSLAPIVEKTSPAVVNIRVSQTVAARQFGNEAFRRYFGLPEVPQRGTRQATSAGSGVIVDADNGYILTNHHVVDGADKIEISTFDGRLLDAEVVGSDQRTDIAVIRVDADDLVEMPIGDSEQVRVGDFVLAIGNPFGLRHTVTSGIVSALGRMGVGNGNMLEDFIQTDASINPGNSGGALVNMSGELVGINSAIISRSGGNIGIGFAVPTEIASSIMRQILDFGEVRRGLLGVTIDAVNREEAEALNSPVDRGALVTSVAPGSAAERAGLEVGDIIVEVNTKKIDNASELVNTIGLMSPGEEVSIKYIRGERTRNAMAELGRQVAQSGSGEDIHPGLAGAEFSSSGPTDVRGIEVISVAEGSPAAQRDIRAGDIITAANRVPVDTVDELAQVAGSSSIVFLYIVRGDRTILRQIR